jgi:ABC-type multidrug transport system fused ATPase/permease subunit
MLGEHSSCEWQVSAFIRVRVLWLIKLRMFPGQRIVARLRERTYAAALEQEVEYVEKGEGDVVSRLSVDTSIVGERSELSLPISKTLTFLPA